jgi:hypothetical protein
MFLGIDGRCTAGMIAQRSTAAICFIGLLSLHAGLSAQTRETGPVLGVTPTHYDLDLRLDYEAERLDGIARVTVTNVSERPVSQVPFLLYRLMVVSSARDGEGRTLELEQRVVAIEDVPKQQVNAATVRLSQPLLPRAEATIELTYGGHLLGYAETGMAYVRDRIDASFTILRNDAEAFPRVGRANRAVNRSAGMPSYEYRARIDVPDSLVVANGGALVSREVGEGRAIYTYRSLAPSWRMDFAIGPYLEMREGPVRIFYLPPDSLGAAYMATATRRGLALLEDWFGPLHGEPALTLIEIEDGFGSQTDVVTILQAAAAFRDSMRVRELYHELSHLWNPPDLDRPSPRWNEGMASLLEDLAVEALHDREVVDDYMPRLMAWLKDVAPGNGWSDTPMIDYGRAGKTDASYSVGQLMFYVFYRTVGPEKFRRIVGGFYQANAVKGASTDDFVAYAQGVAGAQLEPLFRDWIYTTAWWDVVREAGTVEQLVTRYSKPASSSFRH